MKPKNAFSTLLTVLITAVTVGVLTGVITYSYAVSKKDLEIEGLKEQLSQISSSIPSAPSNADTDEIKDLSSESSATDTEGWETYKNFSKDYIFTFKYPKNWIIVQRDGSHFTIAKTEDDYKNYGYDGYYIALDTVGGSGDMSAYGEKITGSKITKVIDDEKVDIFEYTKAKFLSRPGVPTGDNLMVLYVFYQDESKKKEYIDIYNKVVSTLKFEKNTEFKNGSNRFLPRFKDNSNAIGVQFRVPSEWVLKENAKFYNSGSSEEWYGEEHHVPTNRTMTAYTQDTPADFGTSKQGITTQKTTVNNYSVYKWTEKDGAVTYSFEAENGEFAYKFTFDKGVDIKIIDQVVNSVSY